MASDKERIATLVPGKQADRVVIRGDPSEGISDIETVEIVFKDGIGYDPTKLIGFGPWSRRLTLGIRYGDDCCRLAGYSEVKVSCGSVPTNAALAVTVELLARGRLHSTYGTYISGCMELTPMAIAKMQ